MRAIVWPRTITVVYHHVAACDHVTARDHMFVHDHMTYAITRILPKQADQLSRVMKWLHVIMWPCVIVRVMTKRGGLNAAYDFVAARHHDDAARHDGATRLHAEYSLARGSTGSFNGVAVSFTVLWIQATCDRVRQADE